MVVEAKVIANEVLELFTENIQEKFNNLSDTEKYNEIIEQVLFNNYNFVVTPTEIDELIENMASVVARGINKSIN